MDSPQISQIVRKYVLENIRGDKSFIESQTLLFQDDYFDSIGLYLLVSFLESEFSFVTLDTDMRIENFESIEAIEKFVLSKISN